MTKKENKSDKMGRLQTEAQEHEKHREELDRKREDMQRQLVNEVIDQVASNPEINLYICYASFRGLISPAYSNTHGTALTARAGIMVPKKDISIPSIEDLFRLYQKDTDLYNRLENLRKQGVSTRFNIETRRDIRFVDGSNIRLIEAGNIQEPIDTRSSVFTYDKSVDRDQEYFVAALYENWISPGDYRGQHLYDFLSFKGLATDRALTKDLCRSLFFVPTETKGVYKLVSE